MAKHMMIDLETWGTRPGCAIRSIGAITFSDSSVIPSEFIPEAFYMNIEEEGQLIRGLHVDPKTGEWWSRQSDVAKAQLEVDQKDLLIVFLAFNRWFATQAPDYVWSHGAAFDIPIYDAAAMIFGLPVPWNYMKVRDTRTLYDLASFKPSQVSYKGTKHNALDDAIYQAKCVQAALNVLKNK